MSKLKIVIQGACNKFQGMIECECGGRVCGGAKLILVLIGLGEGPYIQDRPKTREKTEWKIQTQKQKDPWYASQ